jgi:FkbM family methyltransferase
MPSDSLESLNSAPSKAYRIFDKAWMCVDEYAYKLSALTPKAMRLSRIHSQDRARATSQRDALCRRGLSAIGCRRTLPSDHPRPTTRLACVDRARHDGHIAVSLGRLDELVIDRVGFIKIDVEGHELSVLEGAVYRATSPQPKMPTALPRPDHSNQTEQRGSSGPRQP